MGVRDVIRRHPLVVYFSVAYSVPSAAAMN